MNIEKILAVSPEAYAESVGKKLEDYNLVGLHVLIKQTLNSENIFLSKVPKNAEAVADYRMITPGYFYGTALIPKK
jgi:hypothetical protein